MLDYKRKLLVPAGAIAAAITFAGCTTQIDAGKAANLVKKLFTAKPKSVICPSGINAKGGGHFDCKVTGPDGTKFIVTVHMKDSSGIVEVSSSDARQIGPAAGSASGSSTTPSSGSSSTPTSSTTKSAY